MALPPDQAEAIDELSLTLFNSTGLGPYWGLKVRVAKGLTTGLVFDSTAFASLYVKPVAFASFEENAGRSNSSLFRLETDAVCIVDRSDAAAQVWAS